MKKAGILVVGALAAGGLFLLTRKSNASNALGGTRSTAVRGPVTGKIYPVGIGETGEGGQLNSVFSPDDQTLLFTFVVLPDSSKSLTAQNPEADKDELHAALSDFGF